MDLVSIRFLVLLGLVPYLFWLCFAGLVRLALNFSCGLLHCEFLCFSGIVWLCLRFFVVFFMVIEGGFWAACVVFLGFLGSC